MTHNQEGRLFRALMAQKTICNCSFHSSFTNQSRTQALEEMLLNWTLILLELVSSKVADGCNSQGLRNLRGLH